MDFVERLGPDVAYSVFLSLDNTGDLVRAAAVSRSWRRFVIANDFCRDLIFRSYPEVSDLSHALQVDVAGHSNSSEWDNLERQHKIYALFGWHLSLPSARHYCITQAIAASSTDNDDIESIENTLDIENIEYRSNTERSYWSSSGSKDPQVPETLTYKLISNLCIVDQINIMPFGAYFQYGHPIYSAEAVRFKMGYSSQPWMLEANPTFKPATSAQCEGNEFVWTYVSPAFPMEQAETLQTFKLPRPVICLGGILQVELLGRVQKQEFDDMYYICVSFVEVYGWPLPPAFEVGLSNASGKLALRYVKELEEWDDDDDGNDQSDEEPLNEYNGDDSDYEMSDDDIRHYVDSNDDGGNSGQESISDGSDYFSEGQVL